MQLPLIYYSIHSFIHSRLCTHKELEQGAVRVAAAGAAAQVLVGRTQQHQRRRQHGRVRLVWWRERGGHRVSMVLPWCYRGGATVLPWCYRGVYHQAGSHQQTETQRPRDTHTESSGGHRVTSIPSCSACSDHQKETMRHTEERGSKDATSLPPCRQRPSDSDRDAHRETETHRETEGEQRETL